VVQLSVVRDIALTTTPTDSLPVARDVTFASLLGHDAFAVDIDGVRRSIVGQYAPGKVRVHVELRVRSVLERVRFLAPTFPAPPDGGGGLYLFPVQAVALARDGGVSTVGPNEVLVAAPGGGSVHPSPEWEGAPYDYLRSVSCQVVGGACARWARFAAPLPALGRSAWRWVGFDVDPSVRHIRVRFVLAADLANPD
jgi:hypothetical protein